MRLLKLIYEKKHGKPAPYYYNYSLFTVLTKPLAKWVTNTLAANCPFNCIRIFLYRLCGFKIGKKVFIGMRCYLDDMCHDQLVIEDHVTISYGVFFSCHGKGQGHWPITVKKNAYIGMRASVISKNADPEKQGVVIGEGAVVGAMALVNRDVPAGATAVGVPVKIKEKEKNN